MVKCVNCFEEINEQNDACPYCGYRSGQEAKELYHLYPGTILADRYIVGQVLGFGGFGITYKAWDAKLDAVVAIKEYYPSGLVNRIPGENNVVLFAGNHKREYVLGLERFLKEARNMAKFNSHKNIVNVLEYFEENSTAYIVMEYLDGVSLNDFLKLNQLDIKTSLDVIRSVGAALKEIHSHGIIHRDVSPDNIFLCMNGNVKLIDFGAARFSSNEEQQMTIILKPGFAPTEQYEKVSAQGPWTDIYALGATLYKMLTGEKPEESTSRKVEDTLKAPRELVPEIPENLSNAIMKAMALDKNMRFASVEAFEKAINGEKKVLTLETEKKKRKKKRFLSMLAVSLALLLSGGILGLMVWQEKENETLPAANIAMYYQLTGDQLYDDNKQNALIRVVDSFMASFPDVTIEVIGVEAEEYLDRLGAPAQDGEATAAIFESGMLTAEQVDALSIKVESLLDEGKNAGMCYFFDQYDSCFPEKNRVPFGFCAPVVFYNKTLTDFSEFEVTDFEKLVEKSGKSKGVAILAETAEAIAAAYGPHIMENKKVVIVDTIEAFVAGEYAFLIAFSHEYDEIQSRLPGRYAIASVGAEKVYAKFSDIYSVCSGLKRNEEKVALALMNYMLSDNMQDCYYIQSWTGCLPLNRSALDVVEEVYSDFAGFFRNISNYSFEITSVS